MNIIKSILGLVKKQFFVKPADKDVLIIGKRDELRSSKEPIYTAGAVTFKNLKDEVAAGIDAGADVPEIKGSSINFVPTQNGTLLSDIQLSITSIKAIPFEIFSNVSCTGITFEVGITTGSGSLQLGLYKYDYENDIWNLATAQMDASTSLDAVVTSDFPTPQPLTPGKYCIAWRGNTTLPRIKGFYKLRSTVNFSGNNTNMTGFYNTMVFTTPYNAALPVSIVFDPADFLEQLYHEAFQINF
jgi:hypothetical protein